jgi:hypothetical protein
MATSSRESGHALVESALTLPLVVLLVLGTVQLFMMLQGRILAEYASFRAARAGSINMGDCRVMTHTAIAALLPALARTDTPDNLGRAFERRKLNLDEHGGPIVWLSPQFLGDVEGHQETFDDRYQQKASGAELQLDLTFWYPLRIPFADWMMSRLFLAYWGLQAKGSSAVADELRRRVAAGQYVVPIKTSFRMRQMTPALLRTQPCPNSPRAP